MGALVCPLLSGLVAVPFVLTWGVYEAVWLSKPHEGIVQLIIYAVFLPPLGAVIGGLLPGAIVSLFIVIVRLALGPLAFIQLAIVVMSASFIVALLFAPPRTALIAAAIMSLAGLTVLSMPKRFRLTGFYEPRRFDWRRSPPASTTTNTPKD